MSILILCIGIALLVLLIAGFRFNAFLSFILVSLFIGFANGLPADTLTASLQKGVGDVLGSIVLILGLGAMLGKLIAESGAAQQIATGLLKAFGRRYLLWALVLTAFIIGIPLFYGVGFVLIVPLVITLSYKYDIPAVYIGLPMLAALSVTHGYLPPHPSPVALLKAYKADMGTTLFYGLMIAIPAIIIAGPLFSVTLKKYTAKPLAVFAAKPMAEEALPGLFNSIFSSLLPVLLIGLASIVRLTVKEENTATRIILALGDPVIALLIAVLYAVFSLGIGRGEKITGIMDWLTDAVKQVSMILLIIGGAGGLKEVLTASGTSDRISESLLALHVHPLLAAWSIAAIVRVALGSSTVAGVTTAGIIAPLIAKSGVSPSLMVLATGAGSLVFSHVNDPGFWMFKEYFNLSLKDTLKTWSVMETIVAVTGLIGVFIINSFL
ncbi:MAG: gluconate transporter [Bacteroidetes bacterium]|nr:gluconate transporter [Bacteroidota bacterium]